MDWKKVEALENLCRRKPWNGGEEEWELPIENFLPVFLELLPEIPEGYKESAQAFYDFVKDDSKVYAFDTVYVMAGRAGFKSEDKTRQYILRIA